MGANFCMRASFLGGHARAVFFARGTGSAVRPLDAVRAARACVRAGSAYDLSQVKRRRRRKEKKKKQQQKTPERVTCELCMGFFFHAFFSPLHCFRVCKSLQCPPLPPPPFGHPCMHDVCRRPEEWSFQKFRDAPWAPWAVTH